MSLINLTDAIFYGVMLGIGLLALFIVWRHY